MKKSRLTSKENKKKKKYSFSKKEINLPYGKFRNNHKLTKP